MQILSTKGWNEYELLDCGGGFRLERFGNIVLKRPDPQVIWQKALPESAWQKADASFEKKEHGKEGWVAKDVPERWLMQYQDVSFYAKLSPFKHTGVFPEQSLQWDWMHDQITKAKRSVNVLNLFAYTGIASLVCAAAGASVTHVDASKPTIGWARENQVASGLSERPIRWILDDAIKFTEREVRRGVKYDAIIMDPPVYGHGPDGELWDFPKSFPHLLSRCKQVLSSAPLFILVNAYAISSSALMLENMLLDFKNTSGGSIDVGELALQESKNSRLLSTGIFGRWYTS